MHTLRIEPHSPIRASNCQIDWFGSKSAHLGCIYIWIFLNFKLPICASKFEISWSASKIGAPGWADEFYSAYTSVLYVAENMHFITVDNFKIEAMECALATGNRDSANSWKIIGDETQFK